MNPSDPKSWSPETLAVHAGFEFDELTGAVMPPIYATSTYAQEAPAQTKGYDYSRGDNPTRTPLQSALAELESARGALAFGSGMAAIDAVLQTLQAGDHVLAGHDLYGGTVRLFNQVAVHRGLSFTYVDLAQPGALEGAMRPETKWVWFETPTNPMLSIIDIDHVVKTAHAAGAKVGVDNTFMSPILQSPLAMGADVVMHSITKFINGHSDVIMGCLMTNDEPFFERLKFIQKSVGAVPSPFDCFLVLRGIRTLALRMKQHEANGRAVAEFLAVHPAIKQVYYPGLASHPGHKIAARQQRGFGSMVSVVVDGGIEGATALMTGTRLFKLAESLGGVESLIQHPASMTHASLPKERREAVGIVDGLVRLSCGIEGTSDLVEDLRRALDSL